MKEFPPPASGRRERGPHRSVSPWVTPALPRLRCPREERAPQVVAVSWHAAMRSASSKGGRGKHPLVIQAFQKAGGQEPCWPEEHWAVRWGAELGDGLHRGGAATGSRRPARQSARRPTGSLSAEPVRLPNPLSASFRQAHAPSKPTNKQMGMHRLRAVHVTSTCHHRL